MFILAGAYIRDDTDDFAHAEEIPLVYVGRQERVASARNIASE
jgi:hypothetical protein